MDSFNQSEKACGLCARIAWRDVFYVSLQRQGMVKLYKRSIFVMPKWRDGDTVEFNIFRV